MRNPFHRLAPFVQEFVYAQRWEELRAVQVEACRVLFETDSHLLLATGTASGKTEAAFLPIVTLLHEDPPPSLGALYIGPLKALINDQFERLADLLAEADIPVWHWHGDVPQAHKRKLLNRPRGILQITPESLESLLINRRTHLSGMFADLRFVVIDEVHAFMGTDRGRQVLCLLQRLSPFLRTAPRRVGLSATLGDYAAAESWLAAGTDRRVETPDVAEGKRSVRLAVEHFLLSPEEQGGPAETAEAGGLSAYHDYLFDCSWGRKCLIFANNRADTESTVAALRHAAARRNLPDVFHVHHGSIAAPLREAAESAMRDEYSPAITAATVTLELGIDIGRLERIVQLEAPFSVSSFLTSGAPTNDPPCRFCAGSMAVGERRYACLRAGASASQIPMECPADGSTRALRGCREGCGGFGAIGASWNQLQPCIHDEARTDAREERQAGSRFERRGR